MTNDSKGGDDDDFLGSRATLLAVFIGFGFVGNACLVATIAQSRALRSVGINVVVLNLAMINICDSLLNMPLVFVATVSKSWDFGDTFCGANAFVMHGICLATTIGLLVGAVDRFFALRHPEKYERVFSSIHLMVFLSLTWILALSVSVPFLITESSFVSTSPSHICTGWNLSLVYALILFSACGLLPLLFIIGFYSAIIRILVKRHSIRATRTQKQYRDAPVKHFPFEKDASVSKWMLALTCFWFILEGPFMIFVYGRPLYTMTIAAELSHAGSVMTVLRLMKFSYVIPLPLLAYLCQKEFWQSLKNLVLCRKSNSVVDAASDKNSHLKVKAERADDKCGESKLTEKEKAAFSVSNGSFQVPVLFATANGLHIQTVGNDNISESEVMYADATFDSAELSGVIRGRKCDVFGSQDWLAAGNNTSDYDSGSEIDKYSLSHPISKRNCNTLHHLSHQRSASHPQIGKDCMQTLNSRVSVGDSAIDMTPVISKQLDTSGEMKQSSMNGKVEKVSDSKQAIFSDKNVSNLQVCMKDDLGVEKDLTEVHRKNAEFELVVTSPVELQNNEAVRTTYNKSKIERKPFISIGQKKAKPRKKDKTFHVEQQKEKAAKSGKSINSKSKEIKSTMDSKPAGKSVLSHRRQPTSDSQIELLSSSNGSDVTNTNINKSDSEHPRSKLYDRKKLHTDR